MTIWKYLVYLILFYSCFILIFRATFVVTEKGVRGKKVNTEDASTKKSNFASFGQKYFEVDHPFIFMVWDYYSGMFLLMGRVMNPNVIPS